MQAAPPSELIESLRESRRANRQAEKAYRRAALADARAERELNAWLDANGIRVVTEAVDRG